MGCRCVLDAAETFERHLDRRPRVEDELKRLSSRIETALPHDNAEIERLWREHEASVGKDPRHRRSGTMMLFERSRIG